MDVLQKSSSPVETTLILVCEKCGKKVSGDGDDNISRHLQKDLKAEIGDRFGKHVARAVVSTCLNVCPKDEIVVAFAETEGPTTYFTFKPKHLKEAKTEILQHIGSLKSSKTDRPKK